MNFIFKKRKPNILSIYDANTGNHTNKSFKTISFYLMLWKEKLMSIQSIKCFVSIDIEINPYYS